MFIVISMYTTLFNLFRVVFLTAPVFAAVVDNEIDSNGDHELLKELIDRKDPVDFRFSKVLDIRLDVGEKTPFDVEDTIRSKINNTPGATHKKEGIEDSSHKNDDSNDNFLNKLDGMTNMILNMSVVLNGMIHQIEELKLNVLAALNGISTENEKLGKVEFGLEELKNNISILTKNQTSLHDAVEKNRLLDPRCNITTSIPKDCKEVQARGNHLSGVYEIQPNISRRPFYVLCEMEIRGGGWTHIQKRIDGSQDFYLGWKEYKDGFGDLSREFWLGLENIYSLTAVESELLVELVDKNQTKAYAYYSGFKIGPESDGYSLSHPNFLGGEIGDSMKYHSGQKFSTKDKDQDTNPENCAVTYHSAWWYGSCYHSDLNGLWNGAAWQISTTDNFRLGAKRRMLVRSIS